MSTLTPEDVAEIVAILDGTPYASLEIATSRFRLRVARDTGDASPADAGWSQEWDYGAPASTLRDAALSGVPVLDPVPEGLAGVPAPLPGVFYHAPAPGAPPFVAVGDTVSVDTVVGIVETMKLMNPVHAGLAGTVAAFCVANAVMVETGTALLHISPT
jgi:acetyl-CoA carboxylase biotin carboxyl carrier protein